MKISAFSILFFLTSFGLFGQFRVVVINQKTEQPIENAILKIRENSRNAVNTFFSDKSGEILFDGDFLKSYFELSALGFETIKDTIKNKELLLIRLNSIIDLDPVVVTAQYNTSTVNNSIQKITVISRQQIDQTGANNLADLLTYQTGIRLGNDNILGTTVNLSGISGQNVKILIDGVPVIGRLDGNVDLSQLNLNNVERVEIVEGPLSVNYGTDALGGTINIITKKSTSKKIDFLINPYYESIGNYNLSSSLAWRIKKQTFTVSLARNYFDGWSMNDPFIEFPYNRLADTNRFRTWKPKEQLSGEFRYLTTLKGWSLNPFYRHFNEVIENRGFPQAPYLETAFDDYYNTYRNDFGISINKRFKKSGLTIIAANNHYLRIKNSFIKDLTTLQKTLVQTEGAQDTSRYSLMNFRVNYQFELNKKVEMEVGTDLNYESAFGLRILNQEQFIGDYALFTTLQLKLGKQILLKPAVRYAYNSVYNSPVIPSLNLKWTKKNLSVRASAARGFRAPSLKELYFDFVDINHNIQGSTTLTAEYSWNYSTYLTYLKPVKSTLIKFEYGIFYNDINDLITLGLLEDNTYTYINIGSYSTVGNQAGISFRSKQFNIGLNANYIGRFNPLSNEDSSLDPYFFSPEISANIGCSFGQNKYSLNLFYKYNGELQSFYVNQEGLIETRTQNDYSILDLSFTSKWMNDKLLVIIGGKNLLNVSDVQIIGQSAGVHSSSGNMNVARGMSAFISLKYNLQYERKNAK